MENFKQWYVKTHNIGVGQKEFLCIPGGIVVGTGGNATPIGTLRDDRGCINYLEKEGIRYEEWDEDKIKAYVNPEGL